LSYAKSNKDFLLIGELAEIDGISRDTLRHYERKGVLSCPVRLAKGYRLYSPELIERVKLIRRALAVGFTLDEIARIFAERRRGNAPCRAVYSLAAEKLENVKESLRELEIMRDDLENLVSEWDKKLEIVSTDEPIHLLEALAVSSRNGFGTKGKRNAENLRRKK
jgi:MerR family mercuric resistance operon transcriptional regulator